MLSWVCCSQLLMERSLYKVHWISQKHDYRSRKILSNYAIWRKTLLSVPTVMFSSWLSQKQLLARKSLKKIVFSGGGAYGEKQGRRKRTLEEFFPNLLLKWFSAFGKMALIKTHNSQWNSFQRFDFLWKFWMKNLSHRHTLLCTQRCAGTFSATFFNSSEKQLKGPKTGDRLSKYGTCIYQKSIELLKLMDCVHIDIEGCEIYKLNKTAIH